MKDFTLQPWQERVLKDVAKCRECGEPQAYFYRMTQERWCRSCGRRYEDPEGYRVALGEDGRKALDGLLTNYGST